MSSTNDERPPARRRAAPQLPDPMSPVAPAPQALTERPPVAANTAAQQPATESRQERTATSTIDPFDQQQWSGFTAALGGRVAVEAKALLMPLARAYGLKTERAVIEKLIIDAARAKIPEGPPADR